jgi:hypothetical protein
MGDEPGRDEALLRLNDRPGKRVTVWVGITGGDHEIAILEAEGELRHWTQGQAGAPVASPDAAADLENVAGSYDIGDAASVDLTDVRPLAVGMPLHDHLTIRLDENTTLNVVEQAESEA